MNTEHTQHNPDGNLPPTIRALSNAISHLIDPKPETHNNRIHWTDSLYDQLTEQIPGSQGNASRVPQSSPPLCIDATELKHEIDTTTASWEPRPPIDAKQDHIPPITVLRLQTYEKRNWRPQDVPLIEETTNQLNTWCENITNLLNPQPKWHLPNPCPACDKAIVYRKNSAGETVRQPALQIGPAGCICQNCQHTWAPEYFRFLAKTLGYELPQGVLE